MHRVITLVATGNCKHRVHRAELSSVMSSVILMDSGRTYRASDGIIHRATNPAIPARTFLGSGPGLLAERWGSHRLAFDVRRPRPGADQSRPAVSVERMAPHHVRCHRQA